MRVSKPIEIDAGPYLLRLEGSILTVTQRVKHIEANNQGPVETYDKIPFERTIGGSSCEGVESYPWDVVAHLMRELAKNA